jgi:hypothetical protein
MRIAVKHVTFKDMTRLDMDRIRALCFLCAGAMFFSLAPQTRADELGDRLFAAAQKGDAAGVRAVLAKGVDVNTKFRYGTTALLYAAQKGNPEVVRVLLDHGADVNAKETLSGMTPVMFAAFKGHTAIVKLLLDRGVAEPDPAFAPAVFFGHTETVKALLDSKALKPETLSVGLEAATQAGHKEIAELLRKAGAKPPDPSSGFQPDPDVLKDYAGTYKTPDGMEFSFAVKDGKLTGGNIFDDPATLRPVDKLTFKLPGFEESTILFHVENGKAAAFTWKQRSGDTVFRKAEQK